MPEVTLRPASAADLETLTGGDSPFDDFGPHRWLEVPPASLQDSGLLVVLADGETAGQVGWRWEHWGPNGGSRCPEIGVWLAARFRGRGVGSQAQRQLVELLFTHTTANRVQASTDAENLAEQRALERAGFRREGVLRGAQWRLGSHHDMVLYALIRADLFDDGEPAPAF